MPQNNWMPWSEDNVSWICWMNIVMKYDLLHWNVGSNDWFGWVDTRYVNILVSQMVYCCNSAYDHLPSLKGVFLLTYLGLLMKNHSQTTFRYPRDLLKKATGLKLRSFWRGNQQKHDIAEVRSQTTTRS